MAAITFNAAHQVGHVRGRLESVLTILRETLARCVCQLQNEANCHRSRTRSPRGSSRTRGPRR